MKRVVAALIVIGFATAAFAADLLQWAPPPAEMYQDAGKFCQQNGDCMSGYCLAAEGEKGHGVCKDKKFPGFGCLDLYDKEKGVNHWCAD